MILENGIATKTWLVGLAGLSCLTLCAANTFAAGNSGAPVSQRAEYNVTLSGIPVADASLDAVLEGKSYTISSRFFSAGLANIFVQLQADTHSSGVMSKGLAVPKSYAQDFRRGTKLRRYDISFSKGNVSEFTIVPARKTEPKNWVTIEPQHLKDVQDPLAAMLRPGNSLPCPARLPIFDGEMRFDLVLERLGDADFKTRGYAGKVEVCSVRFEPKSGFRKGREDVDYVARRKDMEIWFAKIDRINAWAPVRLTVPTRYGELKVLATSIGQ